MALAATLLTWQIQKDGAASPSNPLSPGLFPFRATNDQVSGGRNYQFIVAGRDDQFDSPKFCYGATPLVGRWTAK
jgi:hypothetical protein